MHCKNARVSSNQLFGSFFSITRNIWFKKYRCEQDKYFEYDHAKVIIVQMGVYFAVLLIGTAIVALVLPSIAHMDADAPDIVRVLLQILLVTMLIGAPMPYIAWPIAYCLSVKLGIVRKRDTDDTE